jgi:hypothetical protein
MLITFFENYLYGPVNIFDHVLLPAYFSVIFYIETKAGVHMILEALDAADSDTVNYSFGICTTLSVDGIRSNGYSGDGTI